MRGFWRADFWPWDILSSVDQPDRESVHTEYMSKGRKRTTDWGISPICPRPMNPHVALRGRVVENERAEHIRGIVLQEDEETSLLRGMEATLILPDKIRE
jgi:hypothetical protein